jgi:hypothetical protein
MAQDPFFDIAHLAPCATGIPATAIRSLLRAVRRMLRVAACGAGRATDGSQWVAAIWVETALPGATGIGTKGVARREWRQAIVRPFVARYAVSVTLVLIRLPVLVAVMPSPGALAMVVAARL